MKKTLKSLLAVALSLALLYVGAHFTGIAEVKAEAAGYAVGDTMEFGAYPRTDVTEALGSELDPLDGDWISYNYYSGPNSIDGDWEYKGQMKPSDYMRYKDVVYNGEKYRGVTFDKNRPIYTEENFYSDKNNQRAHGYIKGKVYWFKYEPLSWRVLDPDTGLIICNSIIDSQAYNNYIIYANGDYWGDSDKTYFASDYSNSSIRQWLNDDFYNTAFTEEQKAEIKTTALENRSVYSSVYDASLTNDKIFLLSCEEASTDAYDLEKCLKGTDYAKCQGLCFVGISDSDYYGNSFCWLRSPNDSSSAGLVHVDGWIGNSASGDAYGLDGITFTGYGVCPALKLQNMKAAESDTPSDVENGSSDGNTENSAKNKLGFLKTIIVVVMAVIVAAGFVTVMVHDKAKIKNQNYK